MCKEFCEVCLKWHEPGSCEAQPAEDRAIEALIALALFPERTPPTDEEIETFLKEFDEGKHPLTPEDEDALARSRPRLMEMLKASTRKLA